MITVAINGWGRIGRILFRAALQDDSGFEVVAINSRKAEASWVAHLLKYDSVHGIFDKTVEADTAKNALVVDGKEIPILAETDLEKLPWREYEVDLAVESTGAFRDRKNASKHLTAGSKKVLITAPGKEPDVTIVPGVNDEMYDHAAHRIISLASCTTNCLAPVAKVLNDEFGIVKGFMTTVHAYTNDQKILDGRHKDLRRARAAATSIIPTTTGAAKALGIVLPALEGKLDGFALRVPTFNVSIVDLVTELERETTAAEVNTAFEAAAQTSLAGKLAVSHEPLVSIDYIGNAYSSIVDAEYTNVIGDRSNLVKVLSWYDNEWGYSCRCVDMINRIADLGL